MMNAQKAGLKVHELKPKCTQNKIPQNVTFAGFPNQNTFKENSKLKENLKKALSLLIHKVYSIKQRIVHAVCP